MAFVDLNVTVTAAVAGGATANESRCGVLACAMGAWFFGADNGFFFAMTSGPALVTIALIGFLSWIIGAHATIQTGSILAVAHLDFAFGASEAGRTTASV